MFISKRSEGGGLFAEFRQRSRTPCREGGDDPQASGPREGGGRLMQRWGRRGGGSSVCSWVRLVCVECQLIMSLLLTPYVEFFMLSLTSLLNTDRFWVNLRGRRRETDGVSQHSFIWSIWLLIIKPSCHPDRDKSLRPTCPDSLLVGSSLFPPSSSQNISAWPAASLVAGC